MEGGREGKVSLVMTKIHGPEWQGESRVVHMPLRHYGRMSAWRRKQGRNWGGGRKVIGPSGGLKLRESAIPHCTRRTLAKNKIHRHLYKHPPHTPSLPFGKHPSCWCCCQQCHCCCSWPPCGRRKEEGVGGGTGEPRRQGNFALRQCIASSMESSWLCVVGGQKRHQQGGRGFE